MRRRSRQRAGVHCHVCGRALRDRESVKRGMGPVCLKRAEQAAAVADAKAAQE